MVGREGIEPSTNGFRGGFRLYSYCVNQVLAALAKLQINVVQSQFRHGQSWLVTNGVSLHLCLLDSGKLGLAVGEHVARRAGTARIDQ